MEDRRIFEIPERLDGVRFDQALAELLPEYSRNRLQQWIRAGAILLDQQAQAPRARVSAGSEVQVDVRLEPVDPRVQAQPIPLEVVHADDDLLVVNKPAALVVHPAPGNRDGTLQNALLHYDSRLDTLPRAGIVHRLDKDTTGLLVVARNLAAHKALVQELAERRVKREYLALVRGEVIAGGRIEEPIGRHRVDRKRMAVVNGGRPARTDYRVHRRYAGFTLLRVNLHTGRTHQIRVHLAHRHMPLVGDPVYGGRGRYPAGIGEPLRAALDRFTRQALHAWRLELAHPASGEQLGWEAPLPDDFAALLRALKNA